MGKKRKELSGGKEKTEAKKGELRYLFKVDEWRGRRKGIGRNYGSIPNEEKRSDWSCVRKEGRRRNERERPGR